MRAHEMFGQTLVRPEASGAKKWVNYLDNQQLDVAVLTFASNSSLLSTQNRDATTLCSTHICLPALLVGFWLESPSIHCMSERSTDGKCREEGETARDQRQETFVVGNIGRVLRGKSLRDVRDAGCQLRPCAKIDGYYVSSETRCSCCATRHTVNDLHKVSVAVTPALSQLTQDARPTSIHDYIAPDSGQQAWFGTQTSGSIRRCWRRHDCAWNNVVPNRDTRADFHCLR